jgi:hypothetical protein
LIEARDAPIDLLSKLIDFLVPGLPNLTLSWGCLKSKLKGLSNAS